MPHWFYCRRDHCQPSDPHQTAEGVLVAVQRAKGPGGYKGSKSSAGTVSAQFGRIGMATKKTFFNF